VFSIHDVAGVIGRSHRTVREDARLGLVDRRDLASLVRYVSGHMFKDGPSAEARAAYLRLGIELGIDKVPVAQHAPGPKEPIMLLHSIHRRKSKKRKESIIPGPVPPVPGGTPQSV
jgi:hypothetical protein